MLICFLSATLVAGLTLCGAAAGSAAGVEEYVVGDGDVLKITVFDHPDLTTVVRVGSDLVISFPLVGQVRVGGLSVSRVSSVLEELLDERYIISPQVSVFVQEFRSKKAMVLGKVAKPGLFELKGPTSLMELLSAAGGLSPDAGDTATVTRKSPSSGAPALVQVDLRRLIEGGDTTLDVPIAEGDTVFVSPAGVVYVSGEVARAGAFKMEPGMTVKKAISLAGGFTDEAMKESVRLTRLKGSAEETTEVGGAPADPEVPVAAGDSIYVPPAGYFYVTGEVHRPNLYRYEKGTTVLKAVAVAGGFTDKAAQGKIRIIRRTATGEEVREKVALAEPVAPDDVVVVPESFF